LRRSTFEVVVIAITTVVVVVVVSVVVIIAIIGVIAGGGSGSSGGDGACRINRGIAHANQRVDDRVQRWRRRRRPLRICRCVC
jgi:hypothetical protein